MASSRTCKRCHRWFEYSELNSDNHCDMCTTQILEQKKTKYICATCGSMEEDENGFCINDKHDDWLEFVDFSEPDLFECHILRASKNLNMTVQELMEKVKP